MFSVLVEHEEPPAQQDGPVQPGQNTTQPGGYPVQSQYNTQYWDLTNPTDNTGTATNTAQPPAYDSVYPPPAGYTANPPAGYPGNPPAAYGQPGRSANPIRLQQLFSLDTKMGFFIWFLCSCKTYFYPLRQRSRFIEMDRCV